MNKKILTGIVVGAALVPMLAFAQTDTQTQIQNLLSQIKALQEQIKTLVAANAGSGNWKMGSTTDMQMPPGQMGKMRCILLNRNLRAGDHGDDVRDLQNMLAEDSDNEFHAGATGFFGPLTARAVMKFQMRMGIASSTDGSVGPLTRGFFERKCGKGLGMHDGPDMMQGGAVRGTITANNTSNITVQNLEGTSVVINITASTTIKVWNGTSTPPVAGGVADLVVGKYAMADGPRNSDGSIQSVHIAVGDTLPPMPPPRNKKDHE